MSKTAQQAYDEIVKYMGNWGGAYSSWYAGIASDPEKRLFTEHHVSKDAGNGWIYRGCVSSNAARSVEKSLLELGCDGGSGGGDSSATSIYAYRKTSATDP